MLGDVTSFGDVIGFCTAAVRLVVPASATLGGCGCVAGDMTVAVDDVTLPADSGGGGAGFLCSGEATVATDGGVSCGSDVTAGLGVAVVIAGDVTGF